MAKAWKIPGLDASKSVKDTLPKILRTRFNEMMSFEKGTIEGKDIDCLHDMRVSSRRLQAAMKIFRPVFPQRQFKQIYSWLRTLIKMLGEVRHYDVFIETLEKYREKLPEREKPSIDLLIVKQNSLRAKKRKILTVYLKQLESSGYRVKFTNFIMKGL
ncbi:MAG: CHAD domain-containing protein [Ignavibacteria bacterium]|jgi:CHAD domain-containing protein